MFACSTMLACVLNQASLSPTYMSNTIAGHTKWAHEDSQHYERLDLRAIRTLTLSISARSRRAAVARTGRSDFIAVLCGLRVIAFVIHRVVVAVAAAFVVAIVFVAAANVVVEETIFADMYLAARNQRMQMHEIERAHANR